MTTCYYFQRGVCTRGDHCHFIHSKTDDVLPPTCRFWSINRCREGDRCPYLHCYFDDGHVEKERQRLGTLRDGYTTSVGTAEGSEELQSADDVRLETVIADNNPYSALQDIDK
jgi:hypothetical protein